MRQLRMMNTCRKEADATVPRPRILSHQNAVKFAAKIFSRSTCASIFDLIKTDKFHRYLDGTDLAKLLSRSRHSSAQSAEQEYSRKSYIVAHCDHAEFAAIEPWLR